MIAVGGLHAMSIKVSPTERDHLRRLVGRPRRPTSRQKALALLTLAEGGTRGEASMRAGIPEDEVSALEAEFAERGLVGVGLLKPRDTAARQGSGRVLYGTIEKAPGICGGAARI